ncbi:MAG: hypothetical protein LBG80_07745 [Bacteroidales bacterium]|jgi:hypothetical protein|nr:hypothetical protein [Bacteroidales bacterium]
MPSKQRRHCERSEAIQKFDYEYSGLLRCARNDVLSDKDCFIIRKYSDYKDRHYIALVGHHRYQFY